MNSVKTAKKNEGVPQPLHPRRHHHGLISAPGELPTSSIHHAIDFQA
jgi:hypothetical protein